MVGEAGESYALAWKFAADHTACDFITKGNKGFLFSIGDEPNLKSYPKNVLNVIFGGQNQDETDASLFAKAAKTWNLFHIFIEHGSRRVNSEWSKLLGQNLTVIPNYTEIPNVISQTILSMASEAEIPMETINDIKITL